MRRGTVAASMGHLNDFLCLFCSSHLGNEAMDNNDDDGSGSRHFPINIQPPPREIQSKTLRF